MTKKNNLKVMEQPYQCKYCGVKFHKETTLSTHMCVKKQRHMDINTAGSRIGFRTFQRFYELTTTSKKVKTTDDFINSPYYIDFVKFGNHVALLKPVHVDKFVEFVILGGLKLKDWTRDDVYHLYILDLIKKEPPASALERTITEIDAWAKENNVEFHKFFSKVHANEGAHLISKGKISPWVLYLSKTGDELLSRFNEDHARIVGDIIDPGYWMKKFKKSQEDVEFIQEILDQSGL